MPETPQRSRTNFLWSERWPLYFMTSKRLVAKRVSGWSDRNLTALRPARYLSVTP